MIIFYFKIKNKNKMNFNNKNELNGIKKVIEEITKIKRDNGDKERNEKQKRK